MAAVRQAARRLALPGTLITDWDNVGRSVWEQKVKADYVHAAADAVKAGNDLIMTTPKFYEGAIEAVRTGLLDESLTRRSRVPHPRP